MIKVLLTFTYNCSDLRYFENRHILILYDANGKRMAWAITDEWQNIVIEHENGIKQVIK